MNVLTTPFETKIIICPITCQNLYMCSLFQQCFASEYLLNFNDFKF